MINTMDNAHEQAVSFLVLFNKTAMVQMFNAVSIPNLKVDCQQITALHNHSVPVIPISNFLVLTKVSTCSMKFG